MNISISVIIPTYNRHHRLIRAIDSVLSQTYPHIELMVIDDGSSNDVQSRLSPHYPQVRFLRQSNQGVSAARNAGIKHSNSEWIAFLDSDDAWHPHKLAKQIAALTKAPEYRLCHTNEIWIRHGNRVNPMNKHKKSGGWIFKYCLPRCAISPSSVLIQRRLLAEIGAFDPTLPACEDYDLWLRICARDPVLYLDQALTIKYGGHSDQLSKKYWGMDRFRISALQKIIDGGTLSADNQSAAQDVLHEKIRIYLLGARKRNKTEEINYYEKLLDRYTKPGVT